MCCFLHACFCLVVRLRIVLGIHRFPAFLQFIASRQTSVSQEVADLAVSLIKVSVDLLMRISFYLNKW